MLVHAYVSYLGATKAPGGCGWFVHVLSFVHDQQLSAAPANSVTAADHLPNAPQMYCMTSSSAHGWWLPAGEGSGSRQLQSKTVWHCQGLQQCCSRRPVRLPATAYQPTDDCLPCWISCGNSAIRQVGGVAEVACEE